MHSTATSLSELAHQFRLRPDHLEFYGRDKAKIALSALQEMPCRGKLILVSAITPTPAGEGKTTMSIGLAQGLKQTGHSVALALRQPSMGPVFGRKGGATGGGRSSLTPAESINLQFTGDFHAITAAHNLLAATLDNRLHFKTTRLDPERVVWKRALDMNDRALRNIRIGMGKQGVQRDSGFDITAASEIMAILCLATSYDDLRDRLNRILLGYTRDGEPVLAEEMEVTGALLAILRDALKPNLVRSLEGVPAFVHGGPFANIAHGCNSVLATRMALGTADFAVTEAGFAFDLGGEKFLDIKCRQAGFAPHVIVLVATIRALKMHGGTSLTDLDRPDPAAVARGLENLAAHLDAAQSFGRPVVVAINQFATDEPEEHAVVQAYCDSRQVPCAVADVFGAGGLGARDLARLVVTAAGPEPRPFEPVYALEDSTEEKIRRIATRIYGADGVDFSPQAEEQLTNIRRLGYGRLPVCMAKTQDSLSDDPSRQGRPKHFRITVRQFEIAAGAGFLVALTGKILRMPALPRHPAAERIQVDSEGVISGLS